ncbi:hypothetical protein KX00_2288 [Francisella sp. TX07-6608]|nr:hypothetical protein KX00_2288 [Francisella sp. TX07-6608]
MLVRSCINIVLSLNDDAIKLTDTNPVKKNQIFFDSIFYENHLSAFKSGWHISEFEKKIRILI